MTKKIMAKRGQVTIFIIVGILIVSAVLVFFLYIKPKFIDDKTAQTGFEGCVKDVIEENMKKLEKGGMIDPEFTYLYNDEKIPYLCYTPDYYTTCTVQVPFLTNIYIENLEKLTSQGINDCYQDSISELREQGYSVTSGRLTYNISLDPGLLLLRINAPTTTGSATTSRINVRFNSPIYEMLMIATSMVQFETGYGDTDSDDFRLLYPDYYYDKIKRSDGTTIYIIEHKDTRVKFKFASRSLAWPAGYG
jgi:hypothetical protein